MLRNMWAQNIPQFLASLFENLNMKLGQDKWCNFPLIDNRQQWMETTQRTIQSNMRLQVASNPFKSHYLREIRFQCCQLDNVGMNCFIHEFHETCHSVTFYFMKKYSKWCCDTTKSESIHTKDESKRGSAFAFIFGVNWPVQWM